MKPSLHGQLGEMEALDQIMALLFLAVVVSGSQLVVQTVVEHAPERRVVAEEVVL